MTLLYLIFLLHPLWILESQPADAKRTKCRQPSEKRLLLMLALFIKDEPFFLMYKHKQFRKNRPPQLWQGLGIKTEKYDLDMKCKDGIQSRKSDCYTVYELNEDEFRFPPTIIEARCCSKSPASRCRLITVPFHVLRVNPDIRKQRLRKQKCAYVRYYDMIPVECVELKTTFSRNGNSKANN